MFVTNHFYNLTPNLGFGPFNSWHRKTQKKWINNFPQNLIASEIEAYY